MECDTRATGEGQLILSMLVQLAKTLESPIFGISINPEHVCKLKRPVAMNCYVIIFQIQYAVYKISLCEGENITIHLVHKHQHDNRGILHFRQLIH